MIDICPAGLEPPTGARKRRKVIVKKRRNPLLRFLPLIRFFPLERVRILAMLVFVYT